MDNKPKMYKAVIFDLDGTLLDTLTDLAAAGNAALEREGLPSYPKEAYRYFVGNGIPKLIERITTGQESKREAVHAAFLAYYRQHMRDATQPYPGIPAMLDALRADGLRLGVVSNKDEAAVQQLVRDYFGDGFQAVAGRREGIPPKPDPTLLKEAMTWLGVSARETVYVGDSGVDMETAAAAGVFSCGVLWGFRTGEELRAAGAGRLIRHPRELTEFVRQAEN